MERHKYFSRSYIYEITLFACFVVYILAWSIITIDRYYSLQTDVYDAGLFMQELYDVPYVHWNLNLFFLSFTLRGLKFILFPIALFKNYPLLFVFQTIWIAAGSPILYFIGLQKNLTKIDSLLLAISYLLFFPIAGANFFDIQNITFLPTLFLAAYYTMIKGNEYTSIILFFFSSIVKYPLSLVVSIFALFLILENFLEQRFEKRNYNSERKLMFYFLILIISLSLFLIRYVYFLVMYHSIFPSDSHIIGYFGPRVTSWQEILTFFILLGPVLFLPLLSIKTLPFMLGYLFLVMYTGFWGYAYPYGLTTIYFYQLEPFLVLGVIEVLSGNSFLKYLVKSKQSVLSKGVKNTNRRKDQIKHIKVFSIFIIILILAMFFQPYGQFNGDNNNTSFNLKNIITSNFSQFRDVEKLVSTVPQGDPYVVIQNGLPEFFPRVFNTTGNPLEEVGILEVPGVSYSIPYNLTYRNSHGVWEKIRIDYVIADPNNPTYYESLAAPYNLSMYDLVKELYGSGQYGIYSEIDGMVVLKHYYNGTIKYYEPYIYSLDGNLLNSNFVSGDNVTISDAHTGNSQWLQVWRTPSLAISHGSYEINITYSYFGHPTNNSIYNIVVSKSGNTINDSISYCLRPFNLGAPNEQHTLHLYSTVNNFTDSFTIFAQIPPDNYWNGTISVSSLSISQINYAKSF